MQTFLPYKDFQESAKCLDMRRLGKQRVEAYQILRIIDGTNPESKWRNHPAVKMWKGYSDALKLYINAMISEWTHRGYNNTMKMYIVITYDGVVDYPPWFGNEEFHASHRSNLLRKDNEYYSKFGWSEPNNLEYVWPV